MKTKIYTLILASAIICIIGGNGCKVSPYKELTIAIVDSIDASKILGPDNLFQIQFSTTEQTNYLMNSSLLDRNTTLLSFGNNKRIKRTQLRGLKDKFLKDNLEPSWLYVNNDSIFVLLGRKLPYKFLLLDSSGNEKKKWLFPHLKNGNQVITLDMNSFVFPFSYNRQSKEFIFTINKPYFSRRDSAMFNTLDNKLICELEEDSVKIKRFFGKIPVKHRNLFLGYSGKMVSTYFDNKTVLSYSQSDSIYSYNNGALVGAHYAKSNDFNAYEEPFDYRKCRNRNYISEFSETGDYYHNIIAGSKYLLRIKIKGNPVEINKNGEIIEKKPLWSIVVLNNNLDYLGEIDMADKDCEFGLVFPLGNERLLLGSYETPHKYYIYEIVQ